MYSEILNSRVILILMLTIGISGCSQMTRHSNTLVFSTNTTIGLNIGQDATQTPKVEIGYNRQEFALVPVLANTEVDGNKLNPCPKDDVDKCFFQASYGGNDRDSYSTIASFGGDVGADASGTKAKVAVAQYFATGVAAQQLVLAGGANVVQAGGDTKAKAEAAGAAAKVEQTKLELKIEKEKANAKEYDKTLNKGKIAAKTVLGDKKSAVDSKKRSALAKRMSGGGCDDAYLATLDQTTVEKFIADLEKQRFQCLARLGNNIDK